MRKQRILIFREPEVYSILLRQLSRRGFRIYPKVRLADVINKDEGEYLEPRLFDYLSRAHLDFLVAKNELPVFAIEFDGVSHLQNGNTIERDVLKNRLCKSANLPLLRISSTEITEKDKLTLLDYMLMRYVAWQQEIDNIIMEIQDFTANLSPDCDPDDLAVDLDPSFHFDLRHPFPGSRLVLERLWRNYRIAWDMDHNRRFASPQLRCDTSIIRSGSLKRDQFHTCEVQASAWNPNGGREEPVFSDVVEVTMRSWLPIRTEVPRNSFFITCPENIEAALEQFKIRIESIWFPDLPGISVWDVSENYANYLGFRAIEQWAKRSLRSNRQAVK